MLKCLSMPMPAGRIVGKDSLSFCTPHADQSLNMKYSKFDPNMLCGSRIMSIFDLLTSAGRTPSPSKMAVTHASGLTNGMYKYL